MNVYQHIIDNLKGRVYGVNALCAISGIEDVTAATIALQKLVHDGRVIRQTLNLNNRGNRLTLYRLPTRFYQPRVAVDKATKGL